MRKPSVNTNPVANQVSGKNERIIEFSSNNGGGLISLWEMADGTLSVHLYRHDDTVKITVGGGRWKTERFPSIAG